QMYHSQEIGMFYTYVLGYMILYMPTLALVNSVAFNQMKDPEKEFPNIRVWGTIGWIVAGLSISYFFHWDSSEGVTQGLLKNTFLLAGIAALILGIFSFVLPKTAPKIDSNEKIRMGDL
ncbi:MAG: MFS transporter, partial [Flavobacterium sp.]